VLVPAQALPADIELSVGPPEESGELESKDRAERMARKSLKSASEPVEYGPEGTRFALPVTIVLPYDPGLLDGYGLKESELKVHYWDRERREWDAFESSVNTLERTVSARTDHFSLYQVLGSQGGSSPSPVQDAPASFGYLDHYVFPNPARPGQRPTFRLQTGLADTVTVRVYDLTGELKHEGSFGGPALLDDGNGKGFQLTYDYAWDMGGAGTGMYHYAITATRAGHAPVKKLGKVGLIK
jgi:hypothetical protein